MYNKYDALFRTANATDIAQNVKQCDEPFEFEFNVAAENLRRQFHFLSYFFSLDRAEQFYMS